MGIGWSNEQLLCCRIVVKRITIRTLGITNIMINDLLSFVPYRVRYRVQRTKIYK